MRLGLSCLVRRRGRPSEGVVETELPASESGDIGGFDWDHSGCSSSLLDFSEIGSLGRDCDPDEGHRVESSSNMGSMPNRVEKRGLLVDNLETGRFRDRIFSFLSIEWRCGVWKATSLAEL